MPIYWLNGARVAINYNNFYDGDWDSIEARNEDGELYTYTNTNPNKFVWTGSHADGTPALDPAPILGPDRTFERTLGAEFARVGRLDGMVGELFEELGGISGPIDGRENEQEDLLYPIYALSPIISIIAPPTPASAASC